MAAWSNVMGAWGEVERLCFRPTPQPLDERLGGGRIADLGAGDDIDEGVAALAPGLRQLGPEVQLLSAEAGFLVIARGHGAGVTSDEGRVGKEGTSRWRSRWAP